MTAQDHYVLVTGANSGLGLSICCRLIDEFYAGNNGSSSLTIIFTTRSSRKGAETLAALEQHRSRHVGRLNKSVHLRPENVDLTNLLSVRALARKLLASDMPYLNSIVLNAGIGSWSGVDWAKVIWDVLTGIKQNTTWPRFKLGYVGLVTKPQFPESAGITEPPLGETFCANVFGHYLLVHYLMPLFHACPPESPANVVWESSIEAVAENYNPADHQALVTDASYEHTKRLTDLLALSANQPAVASSLQTYSKPSLGLDLPPRPKRSTPSHSLCHPGVCTTNIIALWSIVFLGYRIGIFLARVCGSPWANVSSYIGAISACWLALASPSDIAAKKKEAGYSDNNVKWGSSCTLLGHASVQVTDVEGWGIDGSGEPFAHKWWATGLGVGRKTGSKDATKEDVEDFVVEAKGAWEKMEALRLEWDAKMDEYEAQNPSKAANGAVANGNGNGNAH